MHLAALASGVLLPEHIVSGAPISQTSALAVQAQDSQAFHAKDFATVAAAAAAANDPLADALQNKLSILNKQLTQTAQPKPTTVTSPGPNVFLQTIHVKNVKPSAGALPSAACSVIGELILLHLSCSSKDSPISNGETSTQPKAARARRMRAGTVRKCSPPRLPEARLVQCTHLHSPVPALFFWYHSK